MERQEKQGGRLSSRRKVEAVLRLLRGEELDGLSRELGVTAATVARWRDDFLAGGQAALKCRPLGPWAEEVHRLRAKVGELTLDKEALEELLRRHEARHPFVPRRSTR